MRKAHFSDAQALHGCITELESQLTDFSASLRTKGHEDEAALEAQLELLACHIALTGCPSQPNNREREKRQLRRPPKRITAGSVEWLSLKRASHATAPNPWPCLAATSDDGIHYRATLLIGSRLKREKEIKPGSHAFVRAAGEPFLRLSQAAMEFGEASGHPQLSHNEENVLYAGEMEFNAEGEVVRWSNLSGTFQCRSSMAYQAELPQDKLWVVTDVSPHGDIPPASEGVTTNSKGVVLKRVFNISESEFEARQRVWNECLQLMGAASPEAKRHFEELQHGVDERVAAVWTSGYGLSMLNIDPQLL